MKVTETEIEGVLIMEPRVFGDDRGYFFESFSRRDFSRAVGDTDFVQDNESCSSRGVLRGLHFQKGRYAQAKLVRVVRGRILDVAVDLRPGSATRGRYVAVELSGENKRMLFIPKGFAHGYIVLEDDTIFQYKCDCFYEPAAEGSVRWNDPQLNIRWPLEEAGGPILSGKDRQAPLLSELGGDPAEYGNTL